MHRLGGVPADTKAPESFLESTLSQFDRNANVLFGRAFLLEHDYVPELLAKAHRFRSTGKEGLFSLSKDLTRLFIDRLDVTVLRKLASASKGTKLRSLKLLENLLATRVDDKIARKMMAPLVGTYELRHGDAHLPSREYAHAMSCVGVDQDAPYVVQGYQLMHGFMSALTSICQVIAR